MTEHNAIEAIVAESYRTKIDAEDLRRVVKTLLSETLEKERMEDSVNMVIFFQGKERAYAEVLRLIDEKEKGRCEEEHIS